MTKKKYTNPNIGNRMSHIKIGRRSVTFNNHPVASDSHGNKTCCCYATLASCQKQITKIYAEGKLPETAEITGKNGMKFKISTYQDDGYWFTSNIEDGKSWRLWTPYKDEARLKKIIAKKKM